jgi:hypothetical protein
MRGDLEGADRLLAESVEAFRASSGRRDDPSPLNIAEIRTNPFGSLGCSMSSRTR